jgi:hypothetical protein
MTMEPVRDVSRLSWSMMRVSGCGMRNAYRVFETCDNGR